MYNTIKHFRPFFPAPKCASDAVGQEIHAYFSGMTDEDTMPHRRYSEIEEKILLALSFKKSKNLPTSNTLCKRIDAFLTTAWQTKRVADLQSQAA